MIGVSSLAVICLILFLVNKFWGTAVKNIPGPKLGFPILGHLPYLDAIPAKTFLQWKKLYGPIFSIKLGSMNTVILNDWKMIREAYTAPEAQGRPPQPVFQAACKNKGMAFTSGPAVFEQRKFVFKSFKTFCFQDRSNFESIIQEELEAFYKKLNVSLNKPVKMVHEFHIPALNVVWAFFMGERFKHDDPQAKFLVNSAERFFTVDGIMANLGFFVPLVAKLLPQMTGFKSQQKAGIDLYNFIENKFGDHPSGRVEGSPRNYREAWMDKSAVANPDSSFHSSHEYFSATMGDLLLGSIETTGATTDWSLMYLTINQGCQARLQEELDRIVGAEGTLALVDRPNLPYLEAVIHEVLRISSLGPLGLLHYVTEDWNFQGHHIPKDTCLIGNLYAVHKDPQIWDAPEEFRPERFLEKSGNDYKLVNTNQILPFSYGKRVCLGETAARDILFVFLGNIFHKYNVSELPNEVIDVEPVPGLTMTPKPYKVIFNLRRK